MKIINSKSNNIMAFKDMPITTVFLVEENRYWMKSDVSHAIFIGSPDETLREYWKNKKCQFYNGDMEYTTFPNCSLVLE